MSTCGFHGGPATVPCGPDCDLWLEEIMAGNDRTGETGEPTEGPPAPPLELEARYLSMLTFITVAWLLLGGCGFALTYAFTGSMWSAAWALPALVFGMATVRQTGHVMRAIEDHHTQVIVIRRKDAGH